MDRDTKEILENPKMMKMVKKGEQEIKENKKVLWKIVDEIIERHIGAWKTLSKM